jgi:GAF domain-containing protein
MHRETLLAQTFVELADTLVDDFDVIELLTRLTDRCVGVLGASAAGLVLAGPDGGLRVMASSSDAVRLLELQELAAENGPGLDCFRDARPVVNQDLEANVERWPTFCIDAIAAGFRSVHALPLRLRGTTIGALTLFHVGSDDMTQGDVAAAQALADVATIAVLQHRAALEARQLTDQLNHALNSRVAIEQAKGMLAERTGLELEQSFTLLRNYARTNNLRLADVAQTVIDGTLPAAALAPPDPG